MEKATLQQISIFLLLIASSSLQANAFGRGKLVGGRKEVKNVQSNQQVQDLGRYCVRQYNKELQEKGGGGGGGGRLLSFSEVVAAETQVVSGIKYYLSISATTDGGARRTYDAVVVVKPWEESKELLDFSPSPKSDSSRGSKDYIGMLV